MKNVVSRRIAGLMLVLACVCMSMWGCGYEGDGERVFADHFGSASIVGFIDDSLVIVADDKSWSQNFSDGTDFVGRGHQRLRVFNYRIQEDGPRWVDTLDNFVDECDYVLGQLSDSVVWGGQTSLYTKVWKGPLMTFWKIGEKPIVKNISVETERCSQTFFVKNMRNWIEETIIVLSEKSLRYGGDTCQYAVLDTVAGTLTFKRLDENLKWIQKCDDVRAWGDDVYCVILDNEGENSLILKNINDTIPTPRKFAIGGFWGNMIKLSGNICSIHDDEITCSDVIWYGNELKFYENGEVVVDLE